MRTLTLKRDVLTELSADELTGVVAGTLETAYSCLDYVSCHIVDCLVGPTSKVLGA
jgi:hypothetical protein